jgi:hypothetical protein
MYFHTLIISLGTYHLLEQSTVGSGGYLLIPSEWIEFYNDKTGTKASCIVKPYIISIKILFIFQYKANLNLRTI